MEACTIIRTIGDGLHLLAILTLLIRIWVSRSSAGISGKSQILFSLVYASRYMDLGFNYISAYNSTMKLLFISASLTTVALIYFGYRSTYQREEDSMRFEWLVLSCAALAALFSADWTLPELCWTFSIYLEAVAIVPQMYLIYRSLEVRKVIGYYLIAMGTYRAIYCANWACRFMFENKFDFVSVSGGIAQTIIYALFLWWYLVQFCNDDEDKCAAKLTDIENCVRPDFDKAIAIVDREKAVQQSAEMAQKLEQTLDSGHGVYDHVYTIDGTVTDTEGGDIGDIAAKVPVAQATSTCDPAAAANHVVPTIDPPSHDSGVGKAAAIQPPVANGQ